MEDTIDPQQEIVNKRVAKIHKPSLLNRTKSTTIDTGVVIFLMFLAFEILDRFDVQSGTFRGLVLILIFLYEPIMVSINRTLGQMIIGLQVKSFSAIVEDDQSININFLRSIIRYVAKLLLGWISLLTIHSDRYGRAIHDTMGNSVMTKE